MKFENKKIPMLLAAVLVVCAGVTGIRWYVAEDKNTYVFSPDAQDGGYELSGEIPVEMLPEDMIQSYFQIMINGNPEVNAGTRRCNLLVGNPEENEEDTKVTLVLDETGEELFVSEVLKPGDRIAYVEFLQELPRGEHAATATFLILDSETGEEISEVDAGIIIDVP